MRLKFLDNHSKLRTLLFLNNYLKCAKDDNNIRDFTKSMGNLKILLNSLDLLKSPKMID